MITMDLELKSILLAILLVALIVLVVFIIVLISRLNHTVKMANTMLKEGGLLWDGARNKINNAANTVKDNKDRVIGYVSAGADFVKGIFVKIMEK